MAENGQQAATLARARRLVVKVGSALLVREGAVAADWLASVADDLAALRTRGAEILIVTSGAVALGRERLGLSGRLRLEEKQAAAAAGQTRLIEAWQTALAPHALVAAQVLLTLDDTENRRRYLNARATIDALRAAGAVPVINENDTVATSEIRYGDNDRLSAHAAQMAGADLLVLLSDIDGLYTADPRRDLNAQHIPSVDTISDEIAAMAGGADATGVGSGGMATKIAAARIATNAGCAVLIASGLGANPLRAVEQGARATLFAPHSTPERARRAWISGRLKPAGAIIVDAGAAKAVSAGASLLAAGVADVRGAFRRGDAVTVEDAAGGVLARGLAGYDSDEIRRIRGLKTDAIEAALGYRRGAAVIHRDDLAIAAGAGDKP